MCPWSLALASSLVPRLHLCLLERGIIRPSSSSWASSVHLVTKKNDSFGLVHDYRLLNNSTKKQNYLLPWINDLTQQIRGATVFSSLDLKHAFWQLDVRPSGRSVQLFCTSRGNFEYNKLSLGLSCACCSFQTLINHVMRAEVGTCAAIIAAQACGATILLVIALAPQLLLNACADACAASILAILSAIAQAQFKYD